MEDETRPPNASSTFDWIVHALIAIVLVVAIILAFTQSGSDQVTTGLFVACFVFLMLIRQGRVATLKFGKEGLEATMAEAREATERAEKVTKEVKEFMKITAAAVLGLVKRTGRIGGYSYDDKEQIRQEYLANLSEIGMLPEEIADIEEKSRWHLYVEVDYVYCILQGQHFPWGNVFAPGPLLTEADALRHRPLESLPTPEELEGLLSRCGALTNEVREIIEDYRYYHKHHKHRRPEIWAKRYEWYKLIGRAE